MAQHRVSATFGITVDAEFVIDDEEIVGDGPDVTPPTEEQLMQLARAGADEMTETVDVNLGCATFVSGVTYETDVIDDAE